MTEAVLIISVILWFFMGYVASGIHCAFVLKDIEEAGNPGGNFTDIHSNYLEGTQVACFLGVFFGFVFLLLVLVGHGKFKRPVWNWPSL